MGFGVLGLGMCQKVVTNLREVRDFTYYKQDKDEEGDISNDIPEAPKIMRSW